MARPLDSLELAVLSPAEAELTARWRVPAELEMISGPAPSLKTMRDPRNTHLAIHLQGEYIGLISGGPDTVIPGLADFDGVLDLAIGLKNELVSLGMARWVLPAAIDALLADGTLARRSLRLVIDDQNLRAQTAAGQAGFRRAGTHRTRIGGYLVMHRHT